MAPEVPQYAEKYMPENAETFSDGLWYVVKAALKELYPSLTEASGVCFSVLACVLLTSLVRSLGATEDTVDLVAVIAISLLLLQASKSLIQVGTSTIHEISAYGKLILPALAGVMASQGGATASAALYTGTSFFNLLLTTALEHWIIPIIYAYIALSIAWRAIGEEVLKSLCTLLKWLMTWSLKIIIYLFTGYLGITGAVSGATDAAALKAMKITISGAVPIVGNIISDASEAVLVSAGILKSSIGVYGLLAILAIWIAPFLKIALQYLLLKATCTVCNLFGTKGAVGLIGDFSGVMGILAGATSTICLLFLVSLICFLKRDT
ncbi:MAG: hypothetical protein J6Q54_02060 [Oscillospiraceae bacterium]|nr:hypothetical protein [Oscillospiraceae bacterium]